MTTPLSKIALLFQQTAEDFTNGALDLAALIGLPVTTWRAGDPTRVQLKALGKGLGALEAVQVEYAKSAFLDTAEDDWLPLRAKDVYNVDAPLATYSTPTVSFANSGGGLYELVPGELIVQSSASDATFTNQEPITINPSGTVSGALFVAEAAGSSGTVGINDIDTIVSPALLGVTITGSAAAIGSDDAEPEEIRDLCRDSLGALSPNGPADAYEYVVRNVSLTGVTGITRALSDGDTADGTVTVYAATSTAGLDTPTLAALQAAVDTWAQPLCTLATVVSGAPVSVDVTIGGVPAGGDDVAEAAIVSYFASVDMGGTVVRDAISSAVRVALNAAGFTVGPSTPLPVTLPTVDTALTAGQFPVLGSLVAP